MAIYYFIYIIIFFISFLICKELNLVDHQKVEKKINMNDAVLSGGFSLFFYFLICVKFFSLDENFEKILLYTSFIFIVGLIDDRKELAPGSKLIFTIMPTFILMNEGFYINNLGLYNFGTIELGKIYVIFTLLCILLLINAFNYIDGIDGLALSQFLISISYLTFITNDETLHLFYKLILLPLIINLLFNFNIFSKIKIFLGNCGSLILGFLLSFTIIYLAKFKGVHPSFLIWSVFLYVYEFLSVNIIRMKYKKDIFKGGKDHIHHAIYFLCKKSHFKTTLILGLFSSTIMILVYIINIYMQKIFSPLLFFILFFPYYFLRKKIFSYYKY